MSGDYTNEVKPYFLSVTKTGTRPMRERDRNNFVYVGYFLCGRINHLQYPGLSKRSFVSKSFF